MNELVLDANTNLLGLVPGERNADAADLFPALYPYDAVPRVAFGAKDAPMRMLEDIYITDTTFRDGQQSREPFTPAQVLALFDLLHELGGENGIVRQSEFFVYTPQDRAALEACRERGYAFPQITTWIRAAKSDFELIRSLGVPETGILVSASDYHIFNKLGLNRAGALEKYTAIVKMALEQGIRPRCHLEDITRADIPGFVVPFAKELMRLGREAGIPVKIRCCDTLGLGVPYPGAALPRSVPGLLTCLREEAGVPGELLEWHGHNDFHMGVANATAAWLYGAAAVNCTMLGIGERAGNVPLEAMAVTYCSLRGKDEGLRLPVITKIADYFTRELGHVLSPQTPFVGEAFCTTRAGVHADGLLKDERIYSIFDTKALLGRQNDVVVDAHSGLAGVAFWINAHFGLSLDKHSCVVRQVKEAVDGMYMTGRTTALSPGELTLLTKAALNAQGRAAASAG